MVRIRRKKRGEEFGRKLGKIIEFPYDLRLELSKIAKENDCVWLYWMETTKCKHQANYDNARGFATNSGEIKAIVDNCFDILAGVALPDKTQVILNIIECEDMEGAKQEEKEQLEYYRFNVR